VSYISILYIYLFFMIQLRGRHPELPRTSSAPKANY